MNYLKSEVRKIVASIYYATDFYLRKLQGKVSILMYHRIISEEVLNQHFIQPGMYVKNDVFERQMQFLKEHFDILSFSELIDLWNKKGLDENKRYCVITFDDGWLDNYLYACPVLKKYHIPATIFLPTDLIGTNQWFWPDEIGYLLRQYYINNDKKNNQKKLMDSIFGGYPWLKEIKAKNIEDVIDAVIEGCKGLPIGEIKEVIIKIKELTGYDIPNNRALLNWEEIEEISKYNISFGSHSCSHKLLSNITLSESCHEIVDSREIIQGKKINYVPVFCYPNGNYTNEIKNQVKAAGYQAAVSTKFGHEGLIPTDVFQLKRIGIHNDISSTIPLFALRLAV